MQFNVTRNAASVLYSIITYFCLVISILGLSEFMLYKYELMSVITPTTAIISALVFLALLLLKNVDSSIKSKKFCIPLILLCFVFFLFIQFSFLFHMDVNVNLGWVERNPFTLSLAPIFLFIIFSAFLVKIFYKNVQLVDIKNIKLIAFIIVFFGTTIWHQGSLNIVKNEETNARERVYLIESMLNKSLNSQKKAIARIKERVEGLSFDNFETLVNIDAKSYTKDYEVIKGVLVVNKEFDFFSGNNFAKTFHANGMLEKPTIKAWMSQSSRDIQFAANSLTLNSKVPILMFLAPIKFSDNSQFYLLTLLDMNLLLEKDYLKHFSKYDTYIELAPQIYFSVDFKDKKRTSLEELKSGYNNFITTKMSVMDLVEHNTFSFINNYETIHRSTVINQLILWLTFAFVFVVVLIADSSRLAELRAKYDEVTGLLRLEALYQVFTNVQSMKVINSFSTAVLKLDFFEATYNTLGHITSDKLLKDVALRISSQAKRDDNPIIVAKGTGDSFILYFTNTHLSELEEKLNNILREISRTYYFGNIELNLTASCGAVYYEKPDSFDVNYNLQQANIALEKAREHGGNQVELYQQSMENIYKETIEIRNNLYKAIQNNELEVFYQPIHCLNNQTITGVEALVRWPQKGGWISPAKFIPVAETTEQVVRVGELVLSKVISDIKKYPQLQNIIVAVNFSTKHIVKKDFSSSLISLLSQENISFNNFTVEVTESSFQEKAIIENTLHDLIELGVNVAIDDFGTGYSSLSSLANQPANIIKIDREFTLGAEVDSKERRLLDTIITACFDLGKIVVVEGVEDEKLINYLAKHEGIRIQGYFFSKPLPIEQLIDYIKSI
ncbi:GGDEF domain-containing protein [Pseudoalteromonas sp. S1727]|uniref:putative bifunctional diguanylate cyclase/phosphodiesterase n=1 Tax=Pseudoalteromonas sp. S1727 TaxID=2066514 RepID=UPI001109A2A4|nr:phosphodiesterase [Pseudoalteromonas sp. S1727]TMN71514.1 GGDEF domain-containing protein [Pseudoalteromonas sp. S1727]